MIIRTMADKDLLGVQRLLSQLGYETDLNVLKDRFEKISQSTESDAFVCEDDGKSVGFLHVYGRMALEKSAEAVVQSMVTDAQYRRGGIGSKLIMAADRWARERGYQSIVLHTRMDRDDAHGFYMNQGFTAQASAYFMRKLL